MHRIGVPARIALVIAAVALAVVLFVVLRPEDGDGESAERTTQTTEATTQSATATSPVTTVVAPQPPAPEPPPRPKRKPTVTVSIRVREGGGIRRVTVEKGRRVLLVVRAGVSDEVHLHGYDVKRDVAPGAPASLRFRASIVGRFEVELEERHVQIAEIRVQP